MKMRQYILAVDEELHVELVDVEANPLRELPLAGMNEPQKKRVRQLAVSFPFTGDGTKGKGKGKGKGKEKGKERGKEKGKEKGKARGKDKPKEGTSDRSSMKCFFCKEKGHARKDYPKFSAWLAEKKTVGHEQSANAIEEGWIFALDREHEELCELIIIESGASVHVCPPEHSQKNNRMKRDHC